MKKICTVLLLNLLACGILFAQESTTSMDIDLRESILAGWSGEVNSTGLPDIESVELITSDQLGSHVLIANPPPANNGGSPGWGMFLDLIAGPRFVTVTGMTTASTAAAGVGYTIEFFTRTGTALGGPVGSGPGSSSAGWTSLGTVPVIQGAGGSTGVSELFATPVINLNPGDTVGVAMVFSGVGPRYFGTGTPPYQVFADTNLTLITGDARSVPFTTTGSFFSSRALVGEIHYDEFIPVELVSFNALVTGNGDAVELSWITATELNNLGFQVERMTPEAEWNNIGFVNGHGTSTENHIYTFVDNGLSPGTYSYRLKQMDFDGSFEYYELTENIEIGSINTFDLSQNYPNPFNPNTIIKYSVPVQNSFVTLKIFNSLGQEIETLIESEIPAGTYEVQFDATGLSSGVYLYTLSTGNFVESKKMILMK